MPIRQNDSYESGLKASQCPDDCRFRYNVKTQFERREAACFQPGRQSMESRILIQSPMVNKVYPPDQHIRRFLGQWIHTLAAAAEKPFLTSGAKSRFPLGFLR